MKYHNLTFNFINLVFSSQHTLESDESFNCFFLYNYMFKQLQLFLRHLLEQISFQLHLSSFVAF